MVREDVGCEEVRGGGFGGRVCGVMVGGGGGVDDEGGRWL